MRKLRPAIRLYVASIATAAAIALAVALTMPDARALDPVLLLALTAVATVANLQSVHVSAKAKVTVGGAVVFAAVLTLPAAAAMMIGAFSIFVGLRFSTHQRLYNLVFNASGTALGAGAASLVGRLAAGGSDILHDPFAIALSAVTYYLVKTTITDIVVSMQLRREILHGWWMVHRRDIWHHAALYTLGVIAALSVETRPWTIVLFLAPMALVLLSLREATRLRQRTRDAIVRLADLIDERDPYTYGHSQRVAELSRVVARKLRLAPERVEIVTEAARMHDIGKISIPDHILKKPGPLDAAEWVEMRKHCEAGHRFLQQLSDFADGAELVLSHHERVDGAGYPRNLRGTDLPLEASVIAVCDAYDAMTSDRVYRPALPAHRVMEELRSGRGTQWHERPTDALIALIEEGAVAAAVVPQPALSTS